MSASGHHHALSPGRERATLLTLGAVQFTHILDFMIIMPLGAQLMRVFNMSPAQFIYLVACYGIAAAISGFAGGFVLDRFDRKRSLVVLYTGFGIATLACALAPTHGALMFARLAAGAFGGLAGSMVTAMVGDVIPPTRRGRAMSIVMAAFPLVPLFEQQGLGVAILSYDDSLCFGFNADWDLVPDVEELSESIGDAFAELHASAVQGALKVRRASRPDPTDAA